MIASPFSASYLGTADTMESVIQTAALHSWRAMNVLVTTCHTASLADFAVYYHCVHQAFNCPAAGILARQSAEQLAQQPWPGPGFSWHTHLVDQAGVLAWVSKQRAAADLVPVCPPAQLDAFDEALYQQVRSLPVQPAPSHRGLLVHVTRYLRLRQPSPTASRYLYALLAHWPEVPIPEAGGPPLLLGLTDGLAAELLVLIRAHQTGIHHPIIGARVEQGLRYLLALKRDVDFLEQQYSVFPYQVDAHVPDGTFSAELSWRRGDVGQAWLLYEAQAILHDRELVNIAELVGLNTLMRKNLSSNLVVDSGFYQGAAGVAQLYGQLYRSSGQSAYCNAYYYWLSRTQDLLTAPQAPAQDENKLLSGLVGAALVLLAAAKTATPNWRDVLV